MANIKISEPFSVNLEIKETATFRLIVDLFNKSDSTDHDCSVYISIVCSISTDKNATPLFTITLADGIAVSGAGSNRLTFLKDLAFDSGKYVYDVVGTESGGVVVPLMEGKITVVDTVR